MKASITLVAGTVASIVVLSGCARHYNAFRPDAATTQAINQAVVQERAEFAAMEGDVRQIEAEVANETARTGLPAKSTTPPKRY